MIIASAPALAPLLIVLFMLPVFASIAILGFLPAWFGHRSTYFFAVPAIIAGGLYFLGALEFRASPVALLLFISPQLIGIASLIFCYKRRTLLRLGKTTNQWLDAGENDR